MPSWVIQFGLWEFARGLVRMVNLESDFVWFSRAFIDLGEGLVADRRSLGWVVWFAMKYHGV